MLYVIPRYEYKNSSDDVISELERLALNEKKTIEILHKREAIVGSIEINAY